MTIAPPSGIRSSRVGMLPRNSRNSRSGRTRRSCARRRTDPVATGAPWASRSSVDPIRTSATDRRSTKAPISSPRCIARGKVLGGVHGDLGTTVEHGPLHLLREHALAADRVQGDVAGLGAVAERLDQHQFGVDALRAELIGDRLGLGAGLARCPVWRSGSRSRNWPHQVRWFSRDRTGRRRRRRCARPAVTRPGRGGGPTARGATWRSHPA